MQTNNVKQAQKKNKNVTLTIVQLTLWTDSARTNKFRMGALCILSTSLYSSILSNNN